VKRDTDKKTNQDKDKPNTMGEKKDNNNDSSGGMRHYKAVTATAVATIACEGIPQLSF
jgi:hypothetical protein